MTEKSHQDWREIKLLSEIMRRCPYNSTLNDHLHKTSLSTLDNGEKISFQRIKSTKYPLTLRCPDPGIERPGWIPGQGPQPQCHSGQEQTWKGLSGILTGQKQTGSKWESDVAQRTDGPPPILLTQPRSWDSVHTLPGSSQFPAPPATNASSSKPFCHCCDFPQAAFFVRGRWNHTNTAVKTSTGTLFTPQIPQQLLQLLLPCDTLDLAPVTKALSRWGAEGTRPSRPSTKIPASVPTTRSGPTESFPSEDYNRGPLPGPETTTPSTHQADSAFPSTPLPD